MMTSDDAVIDYLSNPTHVTSMITLLGFLAFTGFVTFYSFWKLRKENLATQDGYYLGGRSLTGVVIAGSMLLTNISTEHLIGMNGSAYRNGAIIMAWEVTSAIALVIGALYFIPQYLKMGLTTIPQFLERRFSPMTRTLLAAMLIVSFVVTLLPIVLYTGAINIEAIFEISSLLEVSRDTGIWLTVVVVGSIGAIYAIFGGLKMVAVSDTLNGYGLLIAGLLVPMLALFDIGDGSLWQGLSRVFENSPEKFNVVSTEPSVGPGARDAILPFSVLFTGLMVNQLYFWTMHQSIIQRALGAVNLKEAQKGLLFTGVLKLLVPLIVVLPGIVGYYYFGDSLFDRQDDVYPLVVKRVLPLWMTGFFVAVIMGAVLSTFNSALNSAATIFSLDIYKRYVNKAADEMKAVNMGKLVSTVLAVLSIGLAPYVARAPAGLYQLLQQLNGIFFVPMASVIIAGFFFPKVSARGAIAGLAFGLSFYIVTYFVLAVDVHFVHLWGAEFLLNVFVMHVVSHFYPRTDSFKVSDQGIVEVKPWSYARVFGWVLIVVTILVYVLLGNIG